MNMISEVKDTVVPRELWPTAPGRLMRFLSYTLQTDMLAGSTVLLGDTSMLPTPAA